jgi:hypothetical protein
MSILCAALLMGPATGCASAPGPEGGSTMATPTDDGCADGQLEIRWAPDHPSPARVCVRVGTKISVRLYPPDLHRWTTVVSADNSVVRVGPVGTNQEGVLATTLIAARPGDTVVTSSAEPMPEAPDPGTVAWRLTIEFVASTGA